MRVLAMCLLVVSCGAALTGCGGSNEEETVDSGAYARSVCAAVDTWRQHLTDASAVLATKANSASSLDAVKRQFVSFFQGAVGETDTMLVAVAGAGVPDVDRGDEVATSMLGELREFRPILVQAWNTARRLPVANERKFTTQAQSIGTAFQFEVTKLATLFEAVAEDTRVPEIARAARAQRACAALS